MTLAEFSIRRPVFAWMLMGGLILFGSICYQRLGVSYLPDVDYPVLNIQVAWTGAAPEVMESEVVDPIEQRVIAVEGVRRMTSSVSQGTANISLEFDINRNVNSALQEVQAYVSSVKLPLDVAVPTIRKNNPEDEAILRVVVYGNRSVREMADYVDKYLETVLQTVPGVGNIELSGFGTRELRLWIDENKLKQLQLSPGDVEQAIEDQHEETAGGYLENAQKEVNVRTMGEGSTAAQVGDELILKRGGASIYDSRIHIRDVARVEDGLSDQRSIVRTDGQPSVELNIKKQRGYNEVEVADNLKARLAQLQGALPPGMKTDVTVDFTRFTRTAVEETLHELLLAGLLTSLICYLTLGTWSSALNVLVAIPTSIIGAFIALNFFHFTLNLFTLLALALAIGIVVDDAIMVLENIVRHFEKGKTRRRAALDGSREITFAAIAATIAVVAIFIPVAFMDGVIGRFFFQFSITMTAAVLLSLLEAITLTPMRCSRLLRRSNKNGYLVRASNWTFTHLAAGYRHQLDWCLNRRVFILLASASLFLISLYAATLLRQEFVPSQDQNFFRVHAETPMGSSIYYMDSKVRAIEAYVHRQPEIAHVVTQVGDGHRANTSSIEIVLVDKAKRKATQEELMERFRIDLRTLPALGDVHIWVSDLSARGLTVHEPAPIAFSVRGLEYGKLDQITTQIESRLTATGLVTDLHSNYYSGMPEAQVFPDRAAAAERGVSVDAIAQAINVAIGGVEAGKFTSAGHRYDVELKLVRPERAETSDIQKLDVRNQYGELVPLSEVTKIKLLPSLQTVSRINRERAISVSGNLAPGASQAKVLELAQKIAQPLIPPGYEFDLEGTAASYQNTFGNLWFALFLGIAVAYMVLATQFNSFLHPISVLLALPFSLTGAIFALWLANASLNMFSMIGIILLMGIAKKNSILLVEFTNHVRREDKRALRPALLEACPTRLRPILMTSLATLTSAIPSALGFGPGSETRMPMAIAVIGGIVVSTFFTLFVVPCAYSLMAPWEGPGDEEEEDEATKSTVTAIDLRTPEVVRPRTLA